MEALKKIKVIVLVIIASLAFVALIGSQTPSGDTSWVTFFSAAVFALCLYLLGAFDEVEEK